MAKRLLQPSPRSAEGSRIHAQDQDGWMREGECNGCGACCRNLRLQVPPAYLASADAKNWLSLHGVRVEKIGEGTFAWMNLPCSQLTSENRCAIYWTPLRPATCDSFPRTPADLIGIEDVCSYRFVRRQAGVAA